MSAGFVFKASTLLLLPLSQLITSIAALMFILKYSTSDSRTQPFIRCDRPLLVGSIQSIQNLFGMIYLDHQGEHIYLMGIILVNINLDQSLNQRERQSPYLK